MSILLILVGARFGISLWLFASSVVLLLRWRGAFNGGSDFMNLILVIGLAIGEIIDWRAGLTFVAIQSASSYFISGAVKLLQPEWRSGIALTLPRRNP